MNKFWKSWKTWVFSYFRCQFISISMQILSLRGQNLPCFFSWEKWSLFYYFLSYLSTTLSGSLAHKYQQWCIIYKELIFYPPLPNQNWYFFHLNKANNTELSLNYSSLNKNSLSLHIYNLFKQIFRPQTEVLISGTETKKLLSTNIWIGWIKVIQICSNLV